MNTNKPFLYCQVDYLDKTTTCNQCYQPCTSYSLILPATFYCGDCLPPSFPSHDLVVNDLDGTKVYQIYDSNLYSWMVTHCNVVIKAKI